MRLHSYLAGAVAARTGGEMAEPALLLAGFALAGSAAQASSLLAGITVAAAVGGPVLGALLDRAPRPGRVLAAALVLYACGLAAILTGLGRLPFAVAVAIAVLTGLVGPALSGGWTAQVARLVPPHRLPRANALDAMTFSVGSLAGPALAGTVAEAAGASVAVVAAAALVAAAAPVAWVQPARSAAPPPRPAPVLGSLAGGFRVIVRNRFLARATLTSVVSCTALGMLTACTPVLGDRVLGGAGHGALLLSGMAAAALVANAVLAWFPHTVAADTLLWTGALLQAVALAFAATGHAVVVVVAVLVAGLGDGPQLTALFAIRHREAPDHLRGQVFTTGASLKITGFALGAAAAGPLAAWSLPGALAAAAGVAGFAVLAFAMVPAGRPVVRAR